MIGRVLACIGVALFILYLILTMVGTIIANIMGQGSGGQTPWGG